MPSAPAEASRGRWWNIDSARSWKREKTNISLVILLSRETVYIRKQFLYLYREKSVWLSPDALFQFSVIYNSCRQVLTAVNNSQLLLKLPILDKFRLVTFHTYATQRSYNVRTGIHLVQETREFSWPWYMTCHFEDEHHQACAVFTMMLSCDVSTGSVNQHHYHICMNIQIEIKRSQNETLF